MKEHELKKTKIMRMISKQKIENRKEFWAEFWDKEDGQQKIDSLDALYKVMKSYAPIEVMVENDWPLSKDDMSNAAEILKEIPDIVRCLYTYLWELEMKEKISQRCDER